MCERENSDEECADGLKDENDDSNSEKVNSAPSQPDETSLTDENQHQAKAFPSFAPSSVNSLPPATWYLPPGAWSASGIGIAVRGPNPNSVTPLVMRSALALRPETQSSPSNCAFATEEKKDSYEVPSELCAVVQGEPLGALDPFDLRVKAEEMAEETKSSTASDGTSKQCTDHYSTPESEDRSDDETLLADIISLQESSHENVGTSKELTGTSASAVNLSLVHEDIGDSSSLVLCPTEQGASGCEQDCVERGARRRVKFDNCNPLQASPESRTCGQIDTAFLQIVGSNLRDPANAAELNAGAAAAANPPDTGQSTEDDSDHRWALCKVCRYRLWELIFIPCGHACCKPCYRLLNMICPFCRKRIRNILAPRLSCGRQCGIRGHWLSVFERYNWQLLLALLVVFFSVLYFFL